MAYITVRVVGRDGRPKQGVRVQIMNEGLYAKTSGVVPTDCEGEAEIRWDHGSPMSICVNGTPVKRHEEVKAHFTVVV